MAGRALARGDSSVMAMIGCGSQAEFQALGFRAVLGINDLRIWDVDDRARNLLLRGLRCIGERAMAVPVGRWRVLRHTTMSPSKIGMIVQAALALTNIEKQTR
jgi:ornithine cyclodeaminase/alanine dehydrogenase-like protein (mu-crystallin family)